MNLNISTIQQEAHTLIVNQLINQGATLLLTPTNILIDAVIIILIGALIKAAAAPVATIFIIIGAIMLIASIFMMLG